MLKYFGGFFYSDFVGLLGFDEIIFVVIGLLIDIIIIGLFDIIVVVFNGYLDKMIIDEVVLSEFC